MTRTGFKTVGDCPDFAVPGEQNGTVPFSHSFETSQLADVARRAADAIGAPVAGVDLLPARDGGLYVLEVNAVPGWRALARTLDVDIAWHVLDYVASRASRAPQAP